MVERVSPGKCLEGVADRLKCDKPQVIVVEGPRGSGKTWLLENLPQKVGESSWVWLRIGLQYKDREGAKCQRLHVQEVAWTWRQNGWVKVQDAQPDDGLRKAWEDQQGFPQRLEQVLREMGAEGRLVLLIDDYHVWRHVLPQEDLIQASSRWGERGGTCPLRHCVLARRPGTGAFGKRDLYDRLPLTDSNYICYKLALPSEEEAKGIVQCLCRGVLNDVVKKVIAHTGGYPGLMEELLKAAKVDSEGGLLEGELNELLESPPEAVRCYARPKAAEQRPQDEYMEDWDALDPEEWDMLLLLAVAQVYGRDVNRVQELWRRIRWVPNALSEGLCTEAFLSSLQNNLQERLRRRWLVLENGSLIPLIATYAASDPKARWMARFVGWQWTPAIGLMQHLARGIIISLILQAVFSCVLGLSSLQLSPHWGLIAWTALALSFLWWYREKNKEKKTARQMRQIRRNKDAS